MDSNIQTYNNVLSESEYNKILTSVKSKNIAWFKVPILKDENAWQLSHYLYFEHNVTSDYFSLCKSLLDFINAKIYHRVKLNCNVKRKKEGKLGGFHHDLLYNSEPVKELKVGIYYINTTNGKTLIKENDNIVEIDCEANSLVTFPNTYEHTATQHTDEEFRYVLNINYI